jgi:hypothetical protein
MPAQHRGESSDNEDMAPTIKSAASVSPPATSQRASLDWGEWGAHNEAGAAPASKPSSTPQQEVGHSKVDGFDRFMRAMDRIESVLERVTGTSRDERITRNADNAWKGPFRF